MRCYLIDTSIWIDLYEDRIGYNGEPLGEYAWKLLSRIQVNGDKIIITDFLIRELETRLSMEQINGLFKSLEKVIGTIVVKSEQWAEASQLSLQRRVPKGDAIHVIIARDNNFILVTRDKHFKTLMDITPHFKPEELV